MKKLIAFALLILSAAGVVCAQQGNQSIPPNSGGGITSVTALPATCTPGITAPVNLTVAPFGVFYCIATNTFSASDNVFFNRFFGRSPQDFGAKGDTQVYFNCGQTTNNHLTCATGHFQATDVGKWYESCSATCNSSAATFNAGTISAFNSSTDVTVSVTAGSTYSNTYTAFGTDDDAAMQLWAASMTGIPTNGVPPQVRGGFLPQGGYAIKQPLKLIYPLACGAANAATCGEGAPNQAGGGTLTPGLWLAGASTTASFIYARVPASFTWPTTSDDTFAVTMGNWAFGTVQNFSVISSQAKYTTTGVTGNIGGLGFVGWVSGALVISTHNYITSIWVQGFHNTTNNMCGFVTPQNDFESSYTYSAIEANDFNGCFGNSQSGQTSGQTLEKIHLDALFFENPSSHNIVFGTSNAGNAIGLKQISLANVHALSGSHSIRFISTTTTNQEVIQLSNFRDTGCAGTTCGIQLDSGTNNLDCHGCYLEDLAGGATDTLATTNSSGTINFYGGSINCTSCTNVFTNAGNIFIYGTKLTGPSIANIQAGAGNTYSWIPVPGANGGWAGKGTEQATNLIANQGAACTNGELGLSAGWQSTGSATVTAVAGTGQTCNWTITTGTTTAANPTVTDTLTNPLPTATIACELNIHGGTHTAAAGEGFTQTTLSATAPVFTFIGTPTNTGATYFVTRRCGP